MNLQGTAFFQTIIHSNNYNITSIMTPNFQNSTLIAPKFNEINLEPTDGYNQKRENFGQNYNRADQRFGNNQYNNKQGPNNYNNMKQKYNKKTRTFEEKVFEIFLL